MQKRNCLLLVCLAIFVSTQAQVKVEGLRKSGPVKMALAGNVLALQWPGSKGDEGQLQLDFTPGKPLFKTIALKAADGLHTIAQNLDPAFVLTVGKRTLDPQSGGWDVFFDKVPTRPYQSYAVALEKQAVKISSQGQHTIIRVSAMHAASFTGALEITLYNGSSLVDVAAVMTTMQDSSAILYDAGLVSKDEVWNNISWCDTSGVLQKTSITQSDSSTNLPVRYRSIMGESEGGNLAVFPAPHQYFYPLDEAFNLRFVWYGNHYHQLLNGFGLGIRQEPEGDHRYVPWFNAKPGDTQRLHFFFLPSGGTANTALEAVKQYTHGDRYAALPGYKTMQSHFHNEFTMDVVRAGKPVPDTPNFVKVFKGLGVDIVHLAEFHGPGHPKGPDSLRLQELQALFAQCSRLSDKQFLLLPSEEVNNFYGGHWLALFPRPVYWIMSRKAAMPFVSTDSIYGKVYRVSDKAEMFKLLQLENGLSWTAHARTKGSVGFPDAYKNEDFYLSAHFLGAAWKNIPADLSLPTLSRRVLDLMDETNNHGLHKHYIGECDIFSMEPANETYAHVNVNYLQLDTLPTFAHGWQSVPDALQQGRFFTTTGEVLLPSFTVNGKAPGETATLSADGKATITIKASWTFPLQFIDIISGDGQRVYHQRMELATQQEFGSKTFRFSLPLKGRRWLRVEAWDVAVNGAFTQTVFLQ